MVASPQRLLVLFPFLTVTKSKERNLTPGEGNISFPPSGKPYTPPSIALNSNFTSSMAPRIEHVQDKQHTSATPIDSSHSLSPNVCRYHQVYKSNENPLNPNFTLPSFSILHALPYTTNSTLTLPIGNARRHLKRAAYVHCEFVSIRNAISPHLGRLVPGN